VCDRIDAIDDGKSQLAVQTVSTIIHVLDAVHTIEKAWIKMPRATIQNCWRRQDFIAEKLLDEGAIQLTPPPLLSSVINGLQSTMVLKRGMNLLRKSSLKVPVSEIRNKEGNEINSKDEN